jgi:hypothetical protein
MRVYIDIEMFQAPREVGGKDGKPKLKQVGQALGTDGSPRIWVTPDGRTVAVKSNTKYVAVYDKDGKHLGDMSAGFSGSILAPKVVTETVTA